MVIPRFTIKLLLIITAVAAVLALVLRSAVKDSEPWAIALCVTLAGIGGVFCLYIVFWGAAWIWDQTLGQVFKPQTLQGGNPFASAGPPRQVIKPTEPQ